MKTCWSGGRFSGYSSITAEMVTVKQVPQGTSHPSPARRRSVVVLSPKT